MFVNGMTGSAIISSSDSAEVVESEICAIGTVSGVGVGGGTVGSGVAVGSSLVHAKTTVAIINANVINKVARRVRRRTD